jgi:hypothetical protein
MADLSTADFIMLFGAGCPVRAVFNRLASGLSREAIHGFYKPTFPTTIVEATWFEQSPAVKARSCRLRLFVA